MKEVETAFTASRLVASLALSPPHWRWARATLLAANPGREIPGTDAVTLAASAFIRDRTRGTTKKVNRDRVNAADLFESDAAPRWRLEAMILTGLPTKQVAQKVGLEYETVETYEGLFFDVRSRLQAGSWIAAHTFGMKPFTGFGPDDLGALWRWVGYRRGEHALDLVYAVTTGTGRERYSVKDLEAAELFVLTARVKPGQTPERLLQLELRLRAEEVGAHPSAYHLPRHTAAFGHGAK